MGPTVKRPFGLIVVPALPPVTVQVTVWGGLLVPVTLALNCWVEPWLTVAVEGLTVTFVTVGPGGGTVTVAVPLLEVSAVDVALTVRAPGL